MNPGMGVRAPRLFDQQTLAVLSGPSQGDPGPFRLFKVKKRRKLRRQGLRFGSQTDCGGQGSGPSEFGVFLQVKVEIRDM